MSCFVWKIHALLVICFTKHVQQSFAMMECRWKKILKLGIAWPITKQSLRLSHMRDVAGDIRYWGVHGS